MKNKGMTPEYELAQKMKLAYGCADTKITRHAFEQYVARGCGMTRYLSYKCTGAPRKRVCATRALDEDTRWVAKAIGNAAQGEKPNPSDTFSSASAARVVVMPLRAVGGIDPTVPHLVSGMLLTSLESVEGLSAVGKDDVEALLGHEEQRDLFGCDTTSCMAEIGGMLSADLVLHGELGRLGSSYALNLTVIDPNESTVRARVSRVLDGDDDTLVRALPGVVKELVARLNETDWKAPSRGHVRRGGADNT